MNDELDKILNKHMRMVTGGAVSNFEAKVEAKAKIKQLIVQARIDQLETTEAWANGMAELAKERIAELQGDVNAAKN